MKQSEKTGEQATERMEFTLSGGCIVCGGAMSVRMSPGAIRGYCGRCSWISKPLIWQSGKEVSVLHPPLAEA